MFLILVTFPAATIEGVEMMAILVDVGDSRVAIHFSRRLSRHCTLQHCRHHFRFSSNAQSSQPGVCGDVHSPPWTGGKGTRSPVNALNHVAS